MTRNGSKGVAQVAPKPPPAPFAKKESKGKAAAKPSQVAGNSASDSDDVAMSNPVKPRKKSFLKGVVDLTLPEKLTQLDELKVQSTADLKELIKVQQRELLTIIKYLEQFISIRF